MARKGTLIDDSPIESWHSLLKKETLYNNNISYLQEYIQFVKTGYYFIIQIELKAKKLTQKEKVTFHFSLFNILVFF